MIRTVLARLPTFSEPLQQREASDISSCRLENRALSDSPLLDAGNRTEMGLIGSAPVESGARRSSMRKLRTKNSDVL